MDGGWGGGGLDRTWVLVLVNICSKITNNIISGSNESLEEVWILRVVRRRAVCAVPCLTDSCCNIIVFPQRKMAFVSPGEGGRVRRDRWHAHELLLIAKNPVVFSTVVLVDDFFW